ncbi:MAG: hypothetical protein RLZZ563_420 [Pseudomonadota bacterium]|jgi:hypothetical protein
MMTGRTSTISRRSLIKAAAAATAFSAPAVVRAAAGGAITSGPMLGLAQLPGPAATLFQRDMLARGLPVLTLDAGLESRLAHEILPHAALADATISGVTSGETAFILAAMLQDRGFRLGFAQPVDARCRPGAGISCLRQLNSDHTVHWALVKSGVNFRA